MSLLELELRAIRMRIDGSDLERSLEWQHDRCIRDRAALYVAADPIVGPAFDALAKALQRVQP